MEVIKCLFWNLNGKNLTQELITLILKHNINIVMAAEAENLDIPHFLTALRRHDRYFENKEVLPKKKRTLLLADKNIPLSTYREEDYFSAYKVHENGKNRLLIVVHLTSARECSEQARSFRASKIAGKIENLEESCNAEAQKEGLPEYHAIVVGDFNLHPFSSGMIGVHGFNAIMDEIRAQKGSRKFQKETVKFYYNPMWNLMGKRENALGTYFYEQNQNDESFYWYTFDQVLLRPELIKDFLWNEFEIISHIGDISLIRNNRIYNKLYSDHLPLKFALNERNS